MAAGLTPADLRQAGADGVPNSALRFACEFDGAEVVAALRLAREAATSWSSRRWWPAAWRPTTCAGSAPTADGFRAVVNGLLVV